MPTPMPTKTVTVPPATVVAPVPVPATTVVQSDPAAVVEAYFAAINAHDYARAWSLGGDHLSSSYSQFAAGFANTATDDVTVLSVSGGTVAVDLTATNNDGSQQMFAGTYTVSGSTITGASIAQVGSSQGGQQGAGTCGAPPNPYGLNLCGRGVRVYNPPSDVCSYFTCIDNFPNGRGYMVECNDQKFSMSGGIDGACSDNGGVAETVYRG